MSDVATKRELERDREQLERDLNFVLSELSEASDADDVWCLRVEASELRAEIDEIDERLIVGDYVSEEERDRGNACVDARLL